MNKVKSKQKDEGKGAYIDIDEDLIQEFLNVSNEGIQEIELDFVTLEKEPQNTDILNKAFRTIHSMKSVAGFLGFNNLESVSHKTEGVLNKLRKLELNLSTDIMDALLNAVDVIKQILEEIGKSKMDIPVNTKDIKNKLVNIINRKKSTSNRVSKQDPVDGIESKKRKTKGHLKVEEAQISGNHVIRDTSESLQKKTPEDLTPTVNTPLDLNSEHLTSKSKDTTPGTTTTKDKNQIKMKEVHTIRIDVDKLDILFNLVGELVLSRNRNLQLYKSLSIKYPSENIINQDLAEAGNQLNSLASDLQWAVMRIRMTPISTVFDRFRRVVRDIGKTLHKELELHITGDNTEIDKNIIEGIKDPITHLIRNSADHGIETQDERIKAGKSKVGRIELGAYYEGNYAVIEVKDNGRGIDAEAVKRKAIERGLITQTSADNMSKKSLLDLVFVPGFSTVEKVTAVSGRGVGMDVVKTNIKRLRGEIIMDSEVGVGTDIKLKIPLTLAILDTLIVNVGDHRYAVPLSNIVETHRIKYRMIEKLMGNMVFRMRNELMPVAALSEIINLPFKYDNNSNVTMIVLRNGLLKMGILVDKTAEQEEVVIKSIDCLDGIAEPYGVSGATILGDGSITFILDVKDLMNLANATSLQAEANVNAEKDTSSQSKENLINVVMVENLGKEQYAIPTRNIKEIKIIDETDIEKVGGVSVIKHRDRIISLTDIPSITKVTEKKKFKNYYMIVLKYEKNEVGLLVGRLLGIKNIDEKSLIKDDFKPNGIMGTAIYEERITLLLNPEEIKKTALSQQSLTGGMLTT